MVALYDTASAAAGEARFSRRGLKRRFASAI
jgi:hypothetical protein